MTTTLTKPLAGICFKIIKGWVNVARNGRGGQIDDQGTPWSRLPAWQIHEQVAREFYTQTSMRSVYRALKWLEEAKLIRREKLWRHERWPGQHYWYTLVEEPTDKEPESGEVHRSSKAKARSELTPLANRGGQPVRTELPMLANHYLNTLTNNSDLNDPPLNLPHQALTELEELDEGVEPEEELEGTNLQSVLSSIPAPRTRVQLDRERDKQKGQRELEKQRAKQQALAKDARKAAVATQNINSQSWIAKELGSIRRRMWQNPAKGFKPTAPTASKKRFLERPEKAVGRDKQGRTIKEVWVSGYRHLVVD